ncbi:hypothetical protein [Paenibacillus sp. S150]|nr:hypothetical protein [Paenibacillus sp. S150]MBW4081062.1 hypothetical protein [Paenibacillus sp. S150]
MKAARRERAAACRGGTRPRLHPFNGSSAVWAAYALNNGKNAVKLAA